MYVRSDITNTDNRHIAHPSFAVYVMLCYVMFMFIVPTVPNGHVCSEVGAAEEGRKDDHQVHHIGVVGGSRCQLVQIGEEQADLTYKRQAVEWSGVEWREVQVSGVWREQGMCDV
jgi:hypothetical protein